MSTQTGAAPDPGLIFETLCAFQQTESLKAAIELEVFTHIADGASTSVEIAKRAQTSERGMRILCDFMTLRGFLTKADGRYANTPTSQVFLNKRSPAYIGSMATFLAHPRLMECFHDMAGSVRKGGTVTNGTLAPEDPIWVEFAPGSMAPFIAMGAEILRRSSSRSRVRRRRCSTLSAGHGVFGLMVAKQNPIAHRSTRQTGPTYCRWHAKTL